MPLVEVKRRSRVFNWRMLSLLDAKAQLFKSQVAQSPGLRFSARLAGPHQGRITGCVPCELNRMTQQQCLSTTNSEFEQTEGFDFI